jgi:hypothetical protein
MPTGDHDGAHPAGKAAVGEGAGNDGVYPPTSAGFKNALFKLRKLGFIEG